MWANEDEFLKEMLDTGCATHVSYDEDGELIVWWNKPKLKLLYPAVYEAVEATILEELEEDLSKMADDGLLAMGFQETADGGIEETWELTDKGREYLNRASK